MEKFRRLLQAGLSEVLCQRDDGRLNVRHLSSTHKARRAINVFLRFQIASRDLTTAHEHIAPCPPRAPKHPPPLARLPSTREPRSRAARYGRSRSPPPAQSGHLSVIAH